MASVSVDIKIDTDSIKALAATVDRMASHFEVAPDDDPAKRAMIAFGEIDTDRDLGFKSDLVDGVLIVTCSMSPELQRIADMVPG